MGTPGDKTKIGKVVRGESSQLDPDQSSEQTPKSPQVTTPSETAVPFPGTSTTEMGFYQRAPYTVTQLEGVYNPNLPQVKAELPYAGTSLEQSTLEDYYGQSKNYSGLAESVQKFYPSVPPQKVKELSKIPAGLDQPGPSGLQTPKRRKPSSEIGKVKKEKKPPTQETPQKKHECQVCQKTFPNAAKLARHQTIHGASSPFKCEYCKKSFSSRFKLVRHALIHSDRKPFCCQVCERTFHRKDHLKNHIKVHSPQKTIYECNKPTCKKEYTSLLSYRKHLALHAAEDGSLECQICSETFETKEQILYHLKIHAGSRTVKNPNEKKFKCNICDRKFFTNKDVRRHLVVHTGMRDFLCQFCPQRFGRKDHLVRHIKKSHSKNLPPEAQKELESSFMIKSETSEGAETSTESTPVKTEGGEGAQYASSLDYFESSLLFGQGFEQLSPMSPVQYLPSTSAQQPPELGASYLESLRESTSDTAKQKKPSATDFGCQFCPQRFTRKDLLARHIDKWHFERLTSESRELEKSTIVKSEFTETSKPEIPGVKTEESDKYTQLEFIEGFGEGSLLFAQGFEQLDPMTPVQYLPSASVRPPSELGGTFLEGLRESTSSQMIPEEEEEGLPNPADISPQLLEETVLLPDSEIMRLLQETTRPTQEEEEEEGKKPLPPFSQTFQSPPPPP